ncbi:MAG: Holliday junction resolvase RuvX [Phycisphaerales bacterium]
MRFLAIDLGAKRTGLAVGDDRTRLVTPLAVLEVPRGPALIQAIARAIDAQGPDALVIGLPLNMDGTEGRPAKETRTFGEALHAAVQLPVEYHDERLTSFAADDAMARSGRTHAQKRAVRDALAAKEVLEDFLRARGG